ncbi:MAG TPA: 16S rRNA (guanine(527)-N(7))-methyltransferase RsmG [Thiobacillaceae bacterium]|nr:16S rRNA (guanine(527)-N(7))-methyltransferase RsmG [Thiobacillaceae bacterium]
MKPEDGLRVGLDALGLAPTLSGEQADRLLAYLDLLNKWNKTYNLTAIREPERMLTHHLLDSLAVLPFVGRDALLDVGSGAGLPGIPLAISRPDLSITLLDVVGKKCAFMQQACIQLGLANTRVVNERVELWRPEARFGQIISRAYGELDDLVRQTGHLLARGGRWLAMKGNLPQTELDHLRGARLVEAIRLRVPDLEAERHLIILEAA